MPRVLVETKHFSLAKVLREEWRDLRPGEAVATVAALRSRFGVSQATVTRALERLQREGLIHRPAGRSRFVMSQIGPRALHHVAIIRPTWPSPDYDALTREIITAGEARNWAFEVYANQNDLEDLDLTRAIGDNDGAITLLTGGRLPDHLQTALRKPSRPVVCVFEAPDDKAVPSVSIDDVQVGKLAVQYLAGKGHRRILAVSSEPMSRTKFDRLAGWRSALRELGVEDVSTLLVDSPTKPTQNSIQVTHEYLTHWLDNRPTDFSAVFCLAWTGALAVTHTFAQRRGLRIPEDVSLLTCAGESLIVPYLNPPLSSIEVDMKAYAQRALDLLEQRFNEPESEPAQWRMDSFVVERASVRDIA